MSKKSDSSKVKEIQFSPIDRLCQRKKAGLTQEQVAKAVGIPRQVVSYLETENLFVSSGKKYDKYLAKLSAKK